MKYNISIYILKLLHHLESVTYTTLYILLQQKDN